MGRCPSRVWAAVDGGEEEELSAKLRRTSCAAISRRGGPAVEGEADDLCTRGERRDRNQARVVGDDHPTHRGLGKDGRDAARELLGVVRGAEEGGDDRCDHVAWLADEGFVLLHIANWVARAIMGVHA
jgi:hypothetical protein